MTRSTTRRFPVWQSMVGIAAVTFLLNAIPRMSVTGKPTQLVTWTIPRHMYTADSRMAPAILRRGFPLAIEAADGGEFITKEGYRRFAFSDSSPKWVLRRVSYFHQLINVLTIGGVGFAVVYVASKLKRRSTGHGEWHVDLPKPFAIND